MSLRKHKTMQTGAKRVMAFLLSLVMICGMLPAVAPTAQAASWMDPYLDKLVSWGVMRGDIDGNLHGDRNITRAEFVSMVNRAYGYDEIGENPFEDVDNRAWYANDIRIAYKAGYFSGTSETTASPESGLTREQAAQLLGKNLLLQGKSGEVLAFSDGREISDWSRGMVQAVAGTGALSGYPDGSFRPQSKITRGEVACMLVKALGEPIQEPGEYALGGVYGNVTITSSGVVLKDTVIAGDLYLTGGIGLGDVRLENVTVLGKIVASGAGESNKGDSSIILRNVTANELVVDSLANQFVTMRVEGDTDIPKTSVRTNGYIEDVTAAGKGLKYIEIDGEPGTSLQLAGNIKEVVNLTPESRLIFAQGVAAKVTIDEKATDSTMRIENGATVKELNLDVGTSVSGGGDIDHMNVNAPGSSVGMLPDTIDVRPGISADVDGETMDTVTAAESSMDPKILAGYPTAQNVAPTNADAVFSTNKKGTIYWAITALADGSVEEEDLIDPPAYSAKILKSGNVVASKSKTEVRAKLTSLVSDGSYYISAVMVDARGERSPVKVAAFTTPDNTVPKFANGYPYMSKITSDSGQVAVMPTKSCQLFWALLPKGGTAPTVADFKAGAISGNKGYGSIDVEKNIVDVLTVNSQTLKEQETYDLYLVLIDADGGKDSGVKKLTFTTVDGTPPIFMTEPTPNSIQKNAVNLLAAINEVGTIYWAVVPEGTEYPKPQAGSTEKPSLDSPAAKLQVTSGMNALKYGKVSAAANKDVTLKVSGLQPQTAYDLYYLAQDKAGNYSETVKKITIHTLDTGEPMITQKFSKVGDAAGKEPMPDTNVDIIFSESIQDENGLIFLELYAASKDPNKSKEDQDNARNDLITLLRKDVKLLDVSSREVEVPERDKDTVGHWIDYSKVEVLMDNGQTVFRFKNNEAIQLNSGATYCFEISDIADTSNNKNMIRPNPQRLPEFTTIFSKVMLESRGLSEKPLEGDGTTEVPVHMNFQVKPMSTASVDKSICYDLFLWADTSVAFDLYGRILDENNKVVRESHPNYNPLFKETGETPDANGWVKLGNEISLNPDEKAKERLGASVHRNVDLTGPFHPLKELKEEYTYEFAISVTRIGDLVDPETWSKLVTIGVTLPVGPSDNIDNLATRIDQNTWNQYLDMGMNKNGVKSVGEPEDFSVFKQFDDRKVPEFVNGRPTFDPGDAFVNIDLQLDRPGTVYYVVAPMEPRSIEVKYTDGTDVPIDGPPTDGANPAEQIPLSKPMNQSIFQPNYGSTRIKTGRTTVQDGIVDLRVEGLDPLTTYFAFFVIKGASPSLSDVFYYRFKTIDVQTPEVTLNEHSPKVTVSTDTPSETNWILFANDSIFPMLRADFAGSYIKTGTDEDAMLDHFPNYDPGDTSTYPTVLDALLTSISGSMKSVFDEYASDVAYNEVLGRIQGRITGDGAESAGKGSLSLKENSPKDVDCTKFMTPETQYYFLAAARNPKGSTYGFKAVGNVHLPDSTPPEYQETMTSTDAFAAKIMPTGLSGYTSSSEFWKGDKATGYAFKGTVSITFDEPIYHLIRNANGKNENVKVTEDNILDFLGVSGQFLELDVVKIGRTITLSFEGATHGSYITFFGDDGYISDANSSAQTKTLRLVFDATKMSTDNDANNILAVPAPAFVATWQ